MYYNLLITMLYNNYQTKLQTLLAFITVYAYMNIHACDSMYSTFMALSWRYTH